MNTYYRTPAPGPVPRALDPAAYQQRRLSAALHNRDWCVLVSLAAQDVTTPHLITDAAIQADTDLNTTLDDLKAWAEQCSGEGYWIKTSTAWGTVLSGLAAAIGQKSLARITNTSRLQPTSFGGGGVA